MKIDPRDKALDNERIIRLLNNHELEYHAGGRIRKAKTCMTRSIANAIMEEFPVTSGQLKRLYAQAERTGQLTNHKG